MSVLDDLERELHRAASRPRRRRLWPAGRAGLLLATGAIVTGSVATAAGLGLVGPEPDRPENFDQAIPTEVTGRTVDDGTLMAVRAEDPDGGPPWGIRVTRTARDAACVQIGRVVQGQLVHLGREGAFDNDGRAHVVPATSNLCVPTDDRGTPILRASTTTSTTAGIRRCTQRQTRAQYDRDRRVSPATDAEWQTAQDDMCTPGSGRLLRWGFAGPDANEVRLAGTPDAAPQRTTLPDRGPGAWLFVRRLPKSPSARVAALRSPAPVSAAFGGATPIAITGPRKVRSLPGVERVRRDTRPGPLDTRIDKPDSASDPITIAFRAPVDALRYPNSYLGYVEIVKSRDPAATRCRRAPITAPQEPDMPRATNVRKGETVTFTIRPPQRRKGQPAAWCPGPHRLRVVQVGASRRGAANLVKAVFTIPRR